MCALIQLSPKFKVRYREDWEEEDLPELQKAFDIAWGLWDDDEKLTDERRKSLRYFAVSAISNWDTKALIQRAIGNSPLNPWLTKEGGDKHQGHIFYMDSEEGLALLGKITQSSPRRLRCLAEKDLAQ